MQPAGVSTARSRPPPVSLRYDVRVRSGGLFVDLVAPHGFGAPSLTLGLDAAFPAIRPMEVAAGSGSRSAFLPIEGRAFLAPGEVPAEVRYQVDLDEVVAALGGDPARGARRGTSWLVDAGGWLLRPSPLPPGTTAHVRFLDGDRDVWTPWQSAPAEPGSYLLDAHALATGGVTAFGALDRRTLSVDAGVLDVTFLAEDRTPDRAVLLAWLGRAAAAVSRQFYGRFPVRTARVLVVSASGDEPSPFGMTLAAGVPGVFLQVGERAAAGSFSDDWVGIHELFHLGNPPWRTRIDWFEEGITTYYTEVLRARAGWFSPAVAWTHLAAGLPYAGSEPGVSVAQTTDFLHQYWGGALFALAIDVAIREKTANRASLDVALRDLWLRARDGRSYTLDQIFAEIDAVAGAPISRALCERYILSPSPPGASALLDRLGVRPIDAGAIPLALRSTAVEVRLDERAPDAVIRDAIVSQAPR